MQRTTEQLIAAALELERPPSILDQTPKVFTHLHMLEVVRALNTENYVWLPMGDNLWGEYPRYRHTHAKPNPPDRHLLNALISEAAEVQHRATKLIQFGATEQEADQLLDNSTRLGQEIGDLLGVIDLLLESGLVPRHTVGYARETKPFRMERWSE